MIGKVAYVLFTQLWVWYFNRRRVGVGASGQHQPPFVFAVSTSPDVSQPTLAHQNERKDEAERGTLGSHVIGQPVEQVQQHVVIDQDLLLGVRLGDGRPPVAEQAIGAGSGFPRLQAEVEPVKAFVLRSFAERSDTRRARLQRPAGRGTYPGRPGHTIFSAIP